MPLEAHKQSPYLPLPLLFLSPSYPLHSLHLAASPKRNGSGVSLNSAAQPDLRLRHHRLLPPAHTAVAMATAIAASAFLFPTFAGGRTLHRQRPAARPRRAAPIGLAVRCEQSDKQKRQPLSALVPREERFMFEGDELCGPDIWNKTWYPKAADHITTEKTWYVVDATDKILGRLASTIAVHIRGKNEPTYTPSVDMGAFVVVVNAEKVAVSGKKRTQKLYRRHSGRPGGMKEETFDQLQKRIPERIVEHAVRGMLPKGRLGRRLFTHLKVYKGPEHPHEAQKPVPLPIRDKRIQKTD